MLVTKEKRERDNNRMRDLLRSRLGSVIFAVIQPQTAQGGGVTQVTQYLC